MKRRKIFCIIAMLGFISLAVFNLNIYSVKIGWTDVFLENVEALAQESDIPDCVPLKGICYKNELYYAGILLK